jgi:hypothetical protein
MAAEMECLVLVKGRYTYSGGDHLKLPKPIKICGQGIGETILDGFGLGVEGWLAHGGSKSNGFVVIEDLSIQGGMTGLHAHCISTKPPLNRLTVRRCNVEKCECNGVNVIHAHISCEDVQVVGCGHSGVIAQDGGTVKFSGENTRIEGNVTSGHNNRFGLRTCDSSSKIQIVTPLTKDSISINNGGSGNWGGNGTIEQVSA